MIYFDNNATTPLAKEVKDEMAACFDIFGNPSSLHFEGQKSRQVIEKARRRVADFIGARPEEIVFTGSGTEANNIAVAGYALAEPDGMIITTAIEHSAVLKPVCRMEDQGRTAIKLLPDADGRIVVKDALGAIRSVQKGLVTIMLANNETGVIQPVRELVEAAKAQGLLVHTDAVQAAGKIPLNVDELGVDMLSISAHKFHGPKGIGALYIRGGVKVLPVVLGGSQEHTMRPGTENVLGIAGIGKACELASECCDSRLRDMFEELILKNVPDSFVNGKNAPRVPNTANIGFKDIDNQALVINLDIEDIAASTGAACSSAKKEASHVLTAMCMSSAEARSSVRFSFSRYNTEEEVVTAVERIRRTVERMRGRLG
ncbi:cysteine desulfurase family protein [Seleniivibrio woodruffii]|uniref:cysteine desulfurase family protein n=1 Tax=Seleniivibrio woodruffii TaxID=1078050 RepID=UPI00240A31F5|nr:cysteine desulfurase family protein [Seleniivibrio woodruffii]